MDENNRGNNLINYLIRINQKHFYKKILAGPANEDFVDPGEDGNESMDSDYSGNTGHSGTIIRI